MPASLIVAAAAVPIVVLVVVLLAVALPIALVAAASRPIGGAIPSAFARVCAVDEFCGLGLLGEQQLLRRQMLLREALAKQNLRKRRE